MYSFNKVMHNKNTPLHIICTQRNFNGIGIERFIFVATVILLFNYFV